MKPRTLACLLSATLTACAAETPAPLPLPHATTTVTATTAAPVTSPITDAPRGPAMLMSPPSVDVATLERVLAASPMGSPDRPRLMRKLAEAYVAIEDAALAEKVAHPNDPAAVARADSIVAAARGKAIAHYTALANEHPGWCAPSRDPKRSGCIDEVLHSLAYELERAGDHDGAERAYRELVRRFPLSRYAPNAYLAFAERLFDAGAGDPAKLADAERLYLRVLDYPENDVAAYAQYKLAWVHMNEGAEARAAADLVKVIEMARADTGARSSWQQLARVARKDLAMVCEAAAQAGRPKPAACAGVP